MDRSDSKHPWPDLGDEGQWAIEMMEELLSDPKREPEELLERAIQLRAEAEIPGLEMYRKINGILAGRYEEAAAARLAST